MTERAAFMNQRFKEALYHFKCLICGETVEWEANFDADGTSYSGWCCGFSYYMSPPVTVHVYVDEEDE